jgi:NAD(P)-dependent dehydrogenase (short-subunit alcohol dehydrogenase family)
MRIEGKIVVVTGGANGIGRALCRRFAADGAKTVVVADIDAAAAIRVAGEIGGIAIVANVAKEQDLVELVRQVTDNYGEIDLFCSNAGILIQGGVETGDAEWQRIWEVDVMAHVYAARAVLPAMLVRGRGYLLQTVSAAGLLTLLGSAPYSVAKHAALALAEWLAITYGDRGIKVSALCPQGVRTGMLPVDSSVGPILQEHAIAPEQVAGAVIEGLAEERFLILPQPEVAEYFRRKATDYERWLRGMRRLQASAPSRK